MFFLMLINIAFIGLCIYNRYFKIPEIAPFGENELLDLECEINSAYKVNKTTEKVENIEPEFLEDEVIQDDDFIVIDYNLDHDTKIQDETFQKKSFLMIYTENKPDYPVYKTEEIENFIFVNNVARATLVVEHLSESVDITKYIHSLLGPNYNYHMEYCNACIIRDAMLIGQLIGRLDFGHLLPYIKQGKFVIYIKDSLGANYCYKPDQALRWTPKLNY